MISVDSFRSDSWKESQSALTLQSFTTVSAHHLNSFKKRLAPLRAEEVDGHELNSVGVSL